MEYRTWETTVLRENEHEMRGSKAVKIAKRIQREYEIYYNNLIWIFTWTLNSRACEKKVLILNRTLYIWFHFWADTGGWRQKNYLSKIQLVLTDCDKN